MKVRVIIQTYNHEKYIACAIESVLAQKTNFVYEVFVIDDFSTDRTRDIVIQFQRANQNKIHTILTEKNYCDNSHFMKAVSSSRSQYIALLDGDDYWVSDEKLQLQADFLDNHPECSMCFHDATVVYENSKIEQHNFNSSDQKTISTIEDILRYNFIAGCSAMFRNGLFGDFPDWYTNIHWGDWPIYILNALYGKIGYINKTMGVYRVHRGGLWSGTEQAQQIIQIIDFYRFMNSTLNYKYDHVLKPMISRYCFKLAMHYKQHSDRKKARAYAWECLVAQPFNRQVSQRQLLGLLLSPPRMF